MAGRTVWRLLFVDDDAEVCRQIKETLEAHDFGEAGSVHVETLTSFDAALEMLGAQRFDTVILDVRLGPRDAAAPAEEIGVRTLEEIKRRAFLPVIFYTALPNQVRHLESPLIRVVEKAAAPTNLIQSVQEILDTRLPQVNRILIGYIEGIQRDYMWLFVAEHWQEFGATADRSALAYLLARRLAVSLSETGIQPLAKMLGDATGAAVAQGRVHPMQYYVLPPVQASPLAGDLYRGQIGEDQGNWVLLTPSCDLVQGREKAERVLLARCTPLEDQTEFQNWRQQLPRPSGNLREDLERLLRNNRRQQPERYFFLPAALTMPNLVVDFQHLVTTPRETLGRLNRLASLDTPYAEALLARFTRYFGRLGVPDLDTDLIIQRLTGGVSGAIPRSNDPAVN